MPTLSVSVVVLALAVSFAQQRQIMSSRNRVTMRVLGARDLGDVAAGKYELYMMEELLEPGAKASPYHQTGRSLHYVLEGSIAVELTKGDVKTYEAGSSFYQAPGAWFYGGYNAGPGRTRVIRVDLLPQF
jgi:quercetin dioxygenase-like cupin family protein